MASFPTQHINELGLEVLKSFESCKLKAYEDVGGVLTIGWGSTGVDVTHDLVWTQEQADNRLKADLERFERGVCALVTNQRIDSNQFSALVDFAYNLGLGALKSSTLLNCINKNNLDVSTEFARWVHVGGTKVNGLVTRRKAEALLFDGDLPGVRTMLDVRNPS